MKRFFLFTLSLGLLAAQLPKEARAVCPMSISGAQKPSCCKSKKAMPCCKFQKADPSPSVIAVPAVQLDRSYFVIGLVDIQIQPELQYAENREVTNHSPPPILVSELLSPRASPATLA